MSLSSILVYFLLALPSWSSPNEPMNGPYIGCGKIEAKIGAPPVFTVTTRTYQHTFILTDQVPSSTVPPISQLQMRVLGAGNMKFVCIRGQVYRDSKGKPILLPISANLELNQVR